MVHAMVRQWTPEEEELFRKREELASVRVTLAEHELNLADLRAQLKSFEGRYLRRVGILYAELDNWDAKIAELESKLEKTIASNQRAAKARSRASASHEAAHGKASMASDFQPSSDLKSLYRKVVRQVHPDFAKNPDDERRRNSLFIQAKEAFDRDDINALQALLDNDENIHDFILDQSVAAELIQVIRQIAHAKKRIAEIDKELALLRLGELSKLRDDVELASQCGRDLLQEIAARVSEQVTRARKEYENLLAEANGRDR